MKKLIIITFDTFLQNFSTKEIVTRNSSLEEAFEKSRDVHLLCNDVGLGSKLSKYLNHKIETVDTDAITKYDDGFIVVPPEYNGSDYEWMRITPLSVAMHARKIFNMRSSCQLAYA